MNFEFQKGLKKRRIIPFAKGRMLVKKELQSAADDLSEAKDRMKYKKYKYVTITAYYSMFHSGRTLLYSKGYREKSHYYLLVALQALFVDTGLIEGQIMKDFRDAMVLREDADYHGEFSKEGAESCLIAAEQFLRRAKAIIEK